MNPTLYQLHFLLGEGKWALSQGDKSRIISVDEALTLYKEGIMLSEETEKWAHMGMIPSAMNIKWL